MSKQLLFVLSSPPAGVPAVEYFEWYEAHLDELLEVRGFVSAQRFLVQDLGSGESPEGHSHLAIYEVEGDLADIPANMAEKDLIDRASYVRKKERDPSGPPLPSWWDEVAFTAWTCVPLGPRHAVDGA